MSSNSELMAAAAQSGAKPAIISITKIRMRNTQDAMVQRTTEFFSKAYFPALQRSGAGPLGAFNALIAADSPFLMLVSQFPSLAAYETSREKMQADKELQKARVSYAAGPLQYVRYETSLLKGFSSFPAIELPSAPAAGKSRIFELRTYESNNTMSLAKKISMFDGGEIAIFRKAGMIPVFFGETIVGQNMPNLTYMVGFDDLAGREKMWSAFASSPEWAKMRSQPGFSDGEIVSNISNAILRPTAFSAIR